MTEPNSTALILGAMREVARDVRASVLAELTPRLDAMAAAIARLDAGEGGTTALLQRIEQHLAVLGRLGGEIHSRVSADASLPRDLLAKPAMADFCDHYPEHATPAVDSTKLDRIAADIAVLSDEEIAERRRQLEEDLPDGAYSQYQLRLVDAAIAAKQRAAELGR